VTDLLSRFRRDYTAAFVRYLSYRDEAALAASYELGRRGLSAGVTLLDVVQVHHEVVIEMLASREKPQDVARAAATFLVEALGSFEMARRGFLEKRDQGATVSETRSNRG
jgi:hypothetical protein